MILHVLDGSSVVFVLMSDIIEDMAKKVCIYLAFWTLCYARQETF